MGTETFTLELTEDQRKQFEWPFGFDITTRLRQIFPNIVIPNGSQFTFTREGIVYVTHGEPTQAQREANAEAIRSLY